MYKRQMGNDGGYLDALVSSSREVISSIDDYRYVKPLVVMFAGMYSQLQSIKHLPHHVRDKWMEAWFFQYSGCSGTGISEPVGLPPVSYTHLDVYKRQLYVCPKSIGA